MRRAQTLGLRLRSLFRSIRVDRELDVELRFHLDEQIEPLPYRDPDRLAMVYSVLAQGPFRCRDCSLSDAAFFELKRGRTFRELAAFGTQISTLTGVGDPVRVHHSSVTANLLSLLGVGPAIGQGFQDGDDTTGRSHVALVS